VRAFLISRKIVKKLSKNDDMFFTMSMGRILKKGDFLFKEFDKIQSVYIIQSGQVGISVFKNKKNVELTTVGTGYVFGENIVLGVPHYSYSAMAVQECKVIEIPVEVFKEQYESFHSVFKSFIKNQSEKLKWALTEIKNRKSDREGMACGYEDVLKVFGSIVSVIKSKGTKDSEKYIIDWTLLKNQNQRFFHEPQRRTEQALIILSKLGFVDLIKQEPEESNIVRLRTDYETVVIKNILQIESFLDFFQYGFYKSGSQELLKIDDSNFLLLQTLLICFDEQKPDQLGFVSMSYQALSEKFIEYGLRLTPTSFAGLESRGLVCKIKSESGSHNSTASNLTQNQTVQFAKSEFETALHCWKLIKEIDKWNDKGVVDDEAPLSPQKKVLTGNEKVNCASCGFELLLNSKFCSQCGEKMTLQYPKKSVA
jgi:CRP-like cAMP-binding protein